MSLERSLEKTAKLQVLADHHLGLSQVQNHPNPWLQKFLRGLNQEVKGQQNQRLWGRLNHEPAQQRHLQCPKGKFYHLYRWNYEIMKTRILKRPKGLQHLISKVLKILKCQIWNFLIVTFEVFKVAEIRFFIVFIPFNFIYLRIHLSKSRY